METQPTVTDHWIDTPHGRLFARRWAPFTAVDAAPIVLFHDSLGCTQLWRRFPATLAEQTGRPVFAYDRLGFGQSDPREGKLGPDFVYEEAQRFFPRLRETLGFDRFIAFGHSVGGGMAVNCAALHGDGCEALITESAQAYVGEETRAGIVEAREVFKQPEQFERLQRLHGAKARWVLDAWIDTWLSAEFANWSLDEVLPKVRCPALVMHGSDDEYGTPRHPERIAGGVAGPSSLYILPGIRHVPHREAEAQVIAQVVEFLASPSP
jgi:pimeloyl-ACP methyl ester carboxylesterase